MNFIKSFELYLKTNEKIKENERIKIQLDEYINEMIFELKNSTGKNCTNIIESIDEQFTKLNEIQEESLKLNEDLKISLNKIISLLTDCDLLSRGIIVDVNKKAYHFRVNNTDNIIYTLILN